SGYRPAASDAGPRGWHPEPPPPPDRSSPTDGLGWQPAALIRFESTARERPRPRTSRWVQNRPDLDSPTGRGRPGPSDVHGLGFGGDVDDQNTSDALLGLDVGPISNDRDLFAPGDRAGRAGGRQSGARHDLALESKVCPPLGKSFELTDS